MDWPLVSIVYHVTHRMLGFSYSDSEWVALKIITFHLYNQLLLQHSWMPSLFSQLHGHFLEALALRSVDIAVLQATHAHTSGDRLATCPILHVRWSIWLICGWKTSPMVCLLTDSRGHWWMLLCCANGCFPCGGSGDAGSSRSSTCFGGEHLILSVRGIWWADDLAVS